MADSTLKRRAGKVLAALKERYPEPSSQLSYNSPWELLVATELAAQCSDARVNQITPAFFARWPGPAELAKAAIEEVEQAIHACGFFHNKARNLIGAAKMVCEKYGGELPRTMAELVKLPGVARKTANIILFAGFGINEGMAVDTHVKRISYRLGLTGSADPVRVERDLVEIFPRREWGDLNHRMVWFGREVCKARKPRCENCPLAPICPKNQPPKHSADEGEASNES